MMDGMGSLPLFSVSALNNRIKDVMESHFPLVRVKGELSNFKPASSGHWYFTLKDEDSMISVVMFKNRSMGVRFQPCDGTEVEIAGSLSVYTKRGSYQIVAESMEETGVGNLLLIIEERKQRLAREGLFDEGRKIPLPLLPRKVALVTSPTGAAVRDMLQVLGRRARGIDVVVVPVPVQGDGAAEKIARGIALADRHQLGDVIIVGRGGGSLEDLAAFSEEVVVRAVAACSLPIISAVGHEIDFALSDFAADLRAPTPSAAAELVAASREELSVRWRMASTGIVKTLLGKLKEVRQALKPYSSEDMERSFRQVVQPWYQRLDDAKEDLGRNMEDLVKGLRHRLDASSRELAACSPLDVLRKGYAIVKDRETGHILAGSTEIKSGQALELVHHDGSTRAVAE